MATTERDYYELLGVSREATDAEIKRAFRALARELHPDVSSEPEADRRFREVAEAFEVLSDPERRATYDRYGHAGLRTGGFRPYADFGSIADVFSVFFGEDLLGGPARARPARGGDVQTIVEIELEEAFAGATIAVPLEVAVSCGSCGATGAEPGTGTRTCSTCGGAGAVRRVSQNVFGQFVQQRTCPECGGVGERLESPCGDCHGEGRSVVHRQLDVEVPAGIQDGQRIRVRGEGHAGFQGAEAGNAFVVVRVRPDPRFVRDGDDLHAAVRIPMTDAALGSKVAVPAFAGDLELEIPAGTQPGEVRVAARAGYAVAARLATRRPAREDRRRAADPAHRRAASAARGASRGRRPRGLREPGRRRLLQPPARRAPLTLRRVSVRVPAESAEEARATLIPLAPAGFEEVEGEGWVELAVYADEPGEQAVRSAFPGAEAIPVEPGWEDAWRAFHRPTRAGGVWIGPPWEEVPVSGPVLVVDPGRAFGTGAHPTTRACIELLARSERGSVLDAGCGSGVIAGVAALLGFSPVHALDSDPVAVEATRGTASRNGVPVEAHRADVLVDRLPRVDARRREHRARRRRGAPRAPPGRACDHLRLRRHRRAVRLGLAARGPARPRRLGRGRPRDVLTRRQHISRGRALS